MGFGSHPHDNMEIITIPLEGDLAHKDSMGNESIIKTGDIQVMSAGTGVYHSEFNPNADLQTKLFQIWLFPNQQNVVPRYQQLSLNPEDKINKLQQILSPNQNEEGVWIHQDAWFHLGKFDKNCKDSYAIKKEGNGVYIFIISGAVLIDNQLLETRDGLGLWNCNSFAIEAVSDCEFLLMDVPMKM